MGIATPAELALQAEVRQLRERIAELENERQAALQQAEEQNRRLLAAVQDSQSTAGAAAHESAARLEAALASMTDAVFIADAQGRFVHTNDAFATYHRFRNREECSKNIADCPDNLNAFLPDGTRAPPEMWAVPRALRGETANNTEYTLQRRDTGETWVGRYSFAPIRGDDGAIVGAVVVARDVTEHKRAEEQVSRSQRTFSKLVERAPFGIYIVDSQFRIAHMNAASQTGAFRNARPVIGRDFAEAMRILWPEPVAAGIIAVFRHTLETGEPYYSPPFFNPRRDVEAVEGYEWELHRMTLPDGQYGVICYYFDSTKLRQAEEALRESEERFRAMADSCPTPIWVTDAAGGNRFVNRKYRELFGVTTDQAEGSKWQPLVHPDDAPEYMAAVVRAVQDRASFQAEARMRRADGDWRRVASYGEPRWSPGGEFLGMGGMSLDVTESRQAEEALRDSEARFRSVLEDSRDVIYRMNLQTGRFEYISASAETVVGFSAEELMAQDSETSFAMIHPDDLPAMQAAIASLHATGKAEAEYRQLTKSGEYRWLSNVMSITTGNAGQLPYRNGSIRDITERKQTEEKLRESEERLRLALEASDLGTWDLDLVTGKTVRSLRHDQIFGYQELQTEWTVDIALRHVLPEDRGRVREAHAPAEGRTAMSVEARVRRPDGSLRWIVSSGHFHYDRGGRAVRMVGVVADITERRLAEEALRQSESEQRRQREFLATLLDNAPCGISVHEGRDFLYELVNPAYQAMVGSDIQLVGRPYRDVFPEAAAAGAEAKLQQAIETGEPWIVDHFRALIPGKPNAIWAGQVVRVPAAAGDEPLLLAIVWDVSEQAATEEALRESERRFRALVTASSEAVYRMSPDWSEMRHLVGRGFIADTDAPSRDWLQKYIHPDDQPRVVAAINEVIGSKGVFELEHRVLRVDGSLGWTFSRAVPLQDANGESVEWFGAASDITERKQAEEARAQTNAQLEGILDSIPEPVMVIDANGRVVRSNHVFERRHLTTVPGALGEYYPVVDVFTEDGHPVPPEMWPLSRAIKGERISGLTLRLSFRNGGPPRFYRYSANPIYDGKGRVTHAVVVFFDVTENRIAQDTLRDSRKQLQDIIDGSPGVVFVKDLEGRFITVNQTFERFLGVTREELRGKTDYDVITRERAEDYREQDRRVAETGEPIQIEEVADLADGRQHVFLANKFPLRDASGKICAVCAISIDITERKQAEDALCEHRAKLAERATQLERITAELEARNRELERISRMKTEFLSRISHELRTPLNAIMGYSDLLSEQPAGPLQSPYPRFVANIQEGAKYLIALVNDLLDISRIESGHFELNIVTFPLAAALDEVLSVVTPLAKIKNIAIDNQVPAGMSIRADRTRLKQVLYNLLSNAVKFTPEDGCVWVAEATCEENAGFCVCDTGIGIPESELESIFDEFHRVGGSGCATEGTGLGLAIARRLVKLHGGAIRVESTVGQGSRFIVSLGPDSAEHHSAR